MELPIGDNSEDFPGHAIWYLMGAARHFFHALAAKEYDPPNVRVLKKVFRWSAALAVGTGGVLVVIDPGSPEEQ